MSTNGQTTEPISQIEQRLKALENQVSSLTGQLGLAEGNDELERQVRQRTASLQALNQELAIELAKSKITLAQSKQAEIALQDSQRFIQRIADASPNIIYVYDIQEQRNIYVNHQISKILGYSPTEIQGMGDNFFINLMHPEDFNRIPDEYARIAIGQDDETFEFEYRMKHANGQWRWLHSRHVVFNRDGDGNVKQTIGTADDITDRKRLEQEKSQLIVLLESSSIGSTEDTTERERLAQENARLTTLLESSSVEIIRLNQLKTDFMSTITHELRSPFNPILGTLNAMQQRNLGPITDHQESSLVVIIDRAKHVLKLIDKILSVASINAVRPEELPISNIETAKFCQARFAAAKEQSKRKGVRLITNIMPNATEIAIDEVRISQVVDELLDNAIKFSKSGGSVSLDVYLEQSSQPALCFSISDHGIGIATEDFDKLFQPFLQLSTGLSRRYNGMGLGLTLAKQLVEQHGGTVEFRSKLDEGSCFVVRLPLITSPVQ
jgi:PAS domain S-box-containing protein